MFRQCISTKAAAAYLGLDPQCLAGWRARGIGPSYIRFPSAFGRNRAPKLGGTILYRLEALEAFVRAMTIPAGRLPHPTAGRPRRGVVAQKHLK